MARSVREQFDRLAKKLISDAEDVDCSLEEFQLGLCHVWHELSDRLDIEEVNPKDPDIIMQLEDFSG